MTASFGVAHTPEGTPRNHCEDPSEWSSHDYGAPGNGVVIAFGQDGNLAGDCDGDGIPADYDGHIEWAIGGGWLSVDSGDGATTGSLYCFGEVGHHPAFGPFTVTDVALGDDVGFIVASDTVSLAPPAGADNCGDFESDDTLECVGVCYVPFPPGLDGTYQVFVCEGAGGHVSNGFGGAQTASERGHPILPGGCVVNSGVRQGRQVCKEGTECMTPPIKPAHVKPGTVRGDPNGVVTFVSLYRDTTFDYNVIHYRCQIQGEQSRGSLTYESTDGRTYAILIRCV